MADDNNKKNLASSGGIADLLGITANDGSNPIRREKTSVIGRPASTNPVT